jgi:hypothetical protein
VVPSTFEQFGLVAVEAMACGCPVVASRTGGFQDTIVEGLTGEFVPVDCAQSLANVLTGYLRNPQRSAWQGKNGEPNGRGEETGGSEGDPFKGTREEMEKAIRRLDALEWVILFFATGMALGGGAMVAWILSVGTRLPFRLTWAGLSVLLLVKPGIGVVGRVMRVLSRLKIRSCRRI